MSALIFDLRNTVNKALFVNAGLEWNGIPTGGLYGFIRQFCSAYYDLRPDHVVVCDDSPPYIRKEHYPEYKANRVKSAFPDADDGFREALSVNIQLVKDFLVCAGIPVWEQKGYEADDMIAVAVKMLKRQGDTDVVIRSSDSDLYQLFRMNQELRFYRFAKGRETKSEDRYYTYENFRNDYPIRAADLPLFLALTGTHNNITGVRGIGPKKASVLLYSEKDLRVVLKEHPEVLKNKKLIKLPFPGIDKSKLSFERGDYNARKVQNFCTKYGINITGTMSAVLFNMLDQ